MNCQGHSYLARQPERLVVQGYRHMLAGCVSRDGEHWRLVRELYFGRLGEDDGRLALAALGEFVAALGRCATCPLRFFPAATDCICRDECLVLGLVSGIQNGDEDGPRQAAKVLSCRRRQGDLLNQAGGFAMTLKLFGQTLLPVPGHVVADIATRAARVAESDHPRTIH